MEVIAKGKYVNVSYKDCVNIAKFIKGRTVKQAITLLQEVLEFKRAIPWKRYKRDQPHKPGIGPGRYPIKATRVFIAILKNLINNSRQKYNIDDPSKIIIETIEIGKAISRKKGKRLRKPKYTHIFIKAKIKNEGKVDVKKV